MTPYGHLARVRGALSLKRWSSSSQAASWDAAETARRGTPDTNVLARFRVPQPNYKAPRESPTAIGRSVDMFFESDMVIATAKPPSKQWYSGNIMVNELNDILDHVRKQTREYLHEQKILASIDSTTNQNSQYGRLQQAPVRWLPREALVELLGGETRMKNTEYRQIVEKLRDIFNLVPFTAGAEAMGPISMKRSPLLVTDPIGLIEARLAGVIKPGGSTSEFEASPDTRLSQQLSLILSFFTRTSSIAMNENSQNVSSTPGGLLSDIAHQGLHRPTGQRDPQGRMRARGGRKTSRAYIWLVPVNENLSNYENAGRPQLQGPLAVAHTGPAAPEPQSVGESAEDRESRLKEGRFFVTDRNDRAVGQVLVNGRLLSEYFALDRHRLAALAPFNALGLQGKYNVFALVRGGGPSAQAQAVAHAVSRALAETEWESIGKLGMMTRDLPWRKTLKKAGLLLRDPRGVERKKTGQPKARKKNTWVKR